MTYHVGITKRPFGPYQIAVYQTHHDFMIASPERHEAENAQELLEILADVYEPPLPWVAIPAGKEEELYRALGICVAPGGAKRQEHKSQLFTYDEEYFRRLGICVAPGEEK